jgi:hypothetical protein
MRGLAALVLVVALPSCGGRAGRGQDLADADLGDPTGSNSPHRFCLNDSACAGGMVCARTETCWPASQIRGVHVIWTVKGMPAGPTTCMSIPDLELDFRSGEDQRPLGYSPVPCVEGKFSIDKLPVTYTMVRLGAAPSWQMTTIGADGNAALDLSP